MPIHNSSKFKVQDTEHSEFRKLPQLDSFESGDLKDGNGIGSNRMHRIKGDLDDPVIRESHVAIGEKGVKESLPGSVFDSRAYFSRQTRHQHSKILESQEFLSGIKDL